MTLKCIKHSALNENQLRTNNTGIYTDGALMKVEMEEIRRTIVSVTSFRLLRNQVSRNIVLAPQSVMITIS